MGAMMDRKRILACALAAAVVALYVGGAEPWVRAAAPFGIDTPWFRLGIGSEGWTLQRGRSGPTLMQGWFSWHKDVRYLLCPPGIVTGPTLNIMVPERPSCEDERGPGERCA
jgi:hypothetical protein